MTISRIKIVIIVMALAVAAVSFFVVSKKVSSAEFHQAAIESLDEKKNTVMELAAASAGASAAITLIPGDVATPIAEELADLSSKFIIVICALYLEKYLLLSAKIALFGLMIFLLVPASVKVSNMIETTYRESIDATIANAQQTTEEIEEAAGAEGQEASGNENANWWEKFTQGVTDTISVKTEEFRDMLNSMMEAFAVMLVTSCVIPILVLVFFAWLVKTILSVNLGAAGTPAKLE